MIKTTRCERTLKGLSDGWETSEQENRTDNEVLSPRNQVEEGGMGNRRVGKSGEDDRTTRYVLRDLGGRVEERSGVGGSV